MSSPRKEDSQRAPGLDSAWRSRFGIRDEGKQTLEDCGIITNMNMLPGDTKAMSGPSGLRLGVPELTRVGMGVDEMQDVARFFARALINKEDTSTIRSEVSSTSPNSKL